MPRPSTQLKPAPAVNADSVFLSPRVVDQAAFSELAGALRELVERAAAGARALTDAGERAEAAQRRLDDSAPLMEARTIAATSALGSLDVRFVETAALASRVGDLALLASSAEARVEAAVLRALEQVAGLESRLVGLAERAERAAAAAERAARQCAVALASPMREPAAPAAAQQIEIKPGVSLPATPAPTRARRRA
jgi:hypothetical protein